MNRVHSFTVLLGVAFLLITALLFWCYFSLPAFAYSPRSGDALHSRIRTELKVFTDWLALNNVKGYIGEVGWPDNSGEEGDSWNMLAETWYKDADAADLWVTNWATGSFWNSTYKLNSYAKTGTVIGALNTQAQVIERHPSTGSYQRGISVAGGEFGVKSDGTFSNANPGVYGIDYLYDPQSTFDYLRSRGITLIRIPFRWERIQPNLNAALNQGELQHLKDAVNRAGSAELRVVLDMHNFGEYWLSNGSTGIKRKLGSPELPNSALVDVWTRLSTTFKDNPYMAGYGIMNEPHDMPDHYDTSANVYDFDADTQSWAGEGATVVSHSTTVSHSGGGSISATKTHGSGASVTRFNDKRGSSVRDISAGGLTLSCFVMIPVGTLGTGWQARIEVQNASYTYVTGPASTLQPGTWKEITYTMPLALAQNARAIAIQASGNAINGTATVYADDCTQRGGLLTGVKSWESVSQQTVDAIRANNDTSQIMISGYNWSGVQDWVTNHPVPWINDPADNFRYEAHHYWDADSSGVYSNTYSNTLTAAALKYTGTGSDPPQILSFTLIGSEPVSSRNITTTMIVSDDIDNPNDLEYKISEYSDFRDASWRPLTISIPLTLSSSSGSKLLYAAVKDSGGNISSTSTLAVEYRLNTPAPSEPQQEPATGINSQSSLAPESHPASISDTSLIDTSSKASDIPSADTTASFILALTIPQGKVFDTAQPTLTGTAPSGSKLMITIHSNQQSQTALADKNGQWQVRPETPLENGGHTYYAQLVRRDSTLGPATKPIGFSVVAAAPAGNKLFTYASMGATCIFLVTLSIAWLYHRSNHRGLA